MSFYLKRKYIFRKTIASKTREMPKLNDELFGFVGANDKVMD
jgi:hypothetical protein